MPRNRRIKPSRLLELWRKYTAFQSSQLAHSTIHRDYRKVERLLAKMPDHLSTSIEVRDWLLSRYAAETTRRYLVQFNACCNWSMESDLLLTNPFTGLSKQIRRKVGHTVWTGFTAYEREAIIETFDKDHPFYAPWVKFLFWTGCRPEEAAGLKWVNVTPDCSRIRFSEAIPIDTRQSQSTKTWKAREFPANQRLRSLLLSLRNPDRAALVFTGEKGGIFDYHNFQTRYWKPTVTKLVEQEVVSVYLSQGHCRHTFITLALEHLPVKDIAYLVGNSPDIIWQHYASRSRNILVPEF
jgi:integrase